MPSEAPIEIFECQKCGQCCLGFGGTYVTPEDVQSISAYLGIGSEEFVSRYLAPSGNRRVLVQGKDGKCIFFNGLCSIHPVKPKMCKAWPFIKPVLADVFNWKIMAGSCPGMKTDVSDETVRACVQDRIREMESEGNC